MLKETTKRLNNMEEPFYIPPEIKAMFEKSKIAVKKYDQDRVFIVTGAEGSGKSLLAKQFGYILNKTITLDDVCFTYEELEKRIRQKERYGVVILDEGNRGLSSRSALSKQNKKLLSLIQEMRQLNLFFIICIPSVFLIEKYIVLHRATALFHTAIYRKDFTKRYYKVYNRKNMKLLYLFGQKYMSYSKPKIYKKYRFYGKPIPTIDEEEYKRKKLESFREEPKRVSEESNIMVQRNLLIAMAHKKWKIKNIDIAKLFKDNNVPMESAPIGRIAQNTEILT